ncbi:MAG TPA: MFS transporter [candidate division Zixibacteria bacterium]|nr:MFS transporter [candidate division Zixibacteria bacterium]
MNFTAAAAAEQKALALRFIVLIGLVSLFADMTYEGARSITGPYLAVLGASGTAVGTVAGFGELIGYGLRLVSGYISDRTGRYWTVTLAGYVVNMVAVPLLALAGSWQAAAFLMIAERAGKAIRTPPRDAMLSHASQSLGRGWVFGLHEALDQVGATLGPLIVTAVLYFNGTYRTGFAVLLAPALLALSALLATRLLYPRPKDLELILPGLEAKGYPRRFWLYVVAASLIGAGYVDFPLIAYHFEKSTMVPDEWIPVLYAVAMGVDAAGAVVLGRLFDRRGVSVLIFATALAALFAPLVFLLGGLFTLVGMALWGLGMGAQESIMRAVVAELIPGDRRASAYGIFNAAFGLFWFAGSLVAGILYDVSLHALVAASMALQLISVPVLLAVRTKAP